MALNQVKLRRVQSLPGALQPDTIYLVQSGADRFDMVATDNASPVNAYAGNRGLQGDKGDKGDRGATGRNFEPDSKGLFAGRAVHDGEDAGYSYLSTDGDGDALETAVLFWKNSSSIGDWSDPTPFGGVSDYRDLLNKPSLGTAAALDIDSDGALSENSDDRIATQKATKAYVDSKSYAGKVLPPTADLNLVVEPGYYQTGSAPANAPTNGSEWQGAMMTVCPNPAGTRIMQIIGSINQYLAFRVSYGSLPTPTWAPWRTLWHSGNFALDADGLLSADSDTRVATQKAIKTYVDAVVADIDGGAAAEAAAESADDAATSASNAATSETNAATSEANSAASAVNAANSALAAAAAASPATNLLFDTFNEYSSTDKNFGSWTWWGSPSPSFTKSSTNIAIKTPVAQISTTADKYYDFSKLGLRVGDTVKVRMIAWFSGSGNSAGVFFRDGAGGTVAASASLSSIGSGLRVIDLSIVVPSGTYDRMVLRIAPAAAQTAEVAAYLAAIGTAPSATRAPMPKDYLDAGVKAATAFVDWRYGLWYLREARQRLSRLKNGQSQQMTLAFIGDSYTHNASRWTGGVSTDLIAEYGDAGGGWLGFAYGGGGTLVNGNMRPSLYTYSRSGTWADTYGTSPSPDACHASSITAGSKISLAGPATPVLSKAKLFWVGTSAGVVRYRWNGGSWTSLNVQAEVGSLQSTDLGGLPVSGAWTLEIEIASGSGTCWLAGIDLQSSANGIRAHKLGATGTSAQQWAALNATNWQSGLSLLAPDLVVIMHGTNDQAAGRSSSQFASDISTIVSRVKAARPATDVLVIMPPDNQSESAGLLPAYSSAVRNLAAGSGRFAFMDLQRVFGDDPAEYASGSSRPWFNADKIHPEPSSGGYAMRDAFIRTLLYG